jgi:hypothetical protein
MFVPPLRNPDPDLPQVFFVIPADRESSRPRPKLYMYVRAQLLGHGTVVSFDHLHGQETPYTIQSTPDSLTRKGVLCHLATYATITTRNRIDCNCNCTRRSVLFIGLL